jgi:hypothetical protein
VSSIFPLVVVEPYFTKVGHNVGYFSNICRALNSRTLLEAIVSSDSTTAGEAHRLSTEYNQFVVKTHGFRYEGSYVKRMFMFISAITATILKVRDKERKILALLAYEPVFVLLFLSFLKFYRLLLVDHSCDYPDRPACGIRSLYKYFSRYCVRRLACRPNVYFIVHSNYHRNRLASVIPMALDRIVEIDYPCTLYPPRTRTSGTSEERVVFLPGLWRKDKGIKFFLEHFPRALLLSN